MKKHSFVLMLCLQVLATGLWAQQPKTPKPDAKPATSGTASTTKPTPATAIKPAEKTATSGTSTTKTTGANAAALGAAGATKPATTSSVKPTEKTATSGTSTTKTTGANAAALGAAGATKPATTSSVKPTEKTATSGTSTTKPTSPNTSTLGAATSPKPATTTTKPVEKVVEKKPIPTADSLFISVENEVKFLQHRVRKGETIYAIKKLYNIELSDFYKNNPGTESKGVKEQQLVKIPFSSKSLLTQKPANFVDSAYSKVYYKVQPKETLYRIAKVYFAMSVETLQERNNLKTTTLSNNQTLHIGWLPKNGVATAAPVDSVGQRFTGLTGVLGEESTRLRKKYDAEKTAGKEEVLQEGKVCWPKHQQINQDNALYVLHDFAKEGTVIRIENPMTQRWLYAKVIGKVPDTPFARGSIAMLSPTVANALGVLDATAHVKIQYLK